MPRSRSFCFEIQFSVPMAASQNWNECVYLVNEDGNALPLYFSLDSDGKTLTVRPRGCVADYSNVTLYVTSSTAGDNGENITKCSGLKVDIYS